jgi:hypothetical protein
VAKHFQVVWKKRRKLQEVQQLNVYPETPQVPYPAWEPIRYKRVSFKSRLLGVEDVIERVLSAESYPAYVPSKENRIEFNAELIKLPELNRYPPTPAPEQPLTSFLPPAINRRHQKRKEIRVLELNQYPVTITLDKTFGVLSIIQAIGKGAQSAITSNGQGNLSILTASRGYLSIIQTRGLGVSSPINNSKGVDSDI